MMYIAMAIKRD